ncbi:cache domain-containing sensor histidine kinase [Cohnella silvisoli]|uniref:Sensor histidine kinase n=1 Tax=Cohnella silvisoli TaxID=2873699 RepID=A0ABV1KLC2_9BACL|nr:sensor histidine kinase [Cohnella silvisoli]MCD9020745.1 sensor histidine kinase [Cohnella silvisoli]
MRLLESLNPMKRMRNFRIRTKILLSNIFIILLLALAIGSAATLASRHYIEANTRELSLNVIDQFSKNVDNRVEEFVNATVFLLNDKLLTQIVSERNGPLTETSYPSAYTRVSNLLFQYGNNNPYINAITIRNGAGRLFWWERSYSAASGLNTTKVQQISDSALGELRRGNQGIVWSASLRGTDEVALTRYYIDINHVNNNFGIIVFHIDRDYFRSLLSDGSIIHTDNLVILNGQGKPLIEGRFGQSSSTIEELAAVIGDGADSSVGKVIRVNGEKALLTQYRSADTGWNILCFIPMNRLLAGTRILETLIIGVCVLFIFVAIVVAFWFSIGTTRDIKLLERTMRRVEDGDFNVKATPAGRDEIGMLAVRFNMMVSRINELITSVYAERLAKQKAEYSVLLAQINPHFLYNTLGTIRWFSRSRGQPEIERMVGALTGLLKSSIRKTGEFHRLSEEMEDVRNYIYIQQIGYGDAFKVEYGVDETLTEGLVPRFIVQPLVENAIMHGLEMSKGTGLIRISASVVKGVLHVAVEDNGIGMDPAKASVLLTEDREKRYPGLNSIGVRNVHERIRSHYGEKYGLTFETAAGDGTKAVIRLPYYTSLEEVDRDVV